MFPIDPRERSQFLARRLLHPVCRFRPCSTRQTTRTCPAACKTSISPLIPTTSLFRTSCPPFLPLPMLLLCWLLALSTSRKRRTALTTLTTTPGRYLFPSRITNFQPTFGKSARHLAFSMPMVATYFRLTVTKSRCVTNPRERGHNFVTSSNYVLPVSQRQEAQHILLRMIFESNYDAPIRELLNSNTHGREVVDLCTGAGHWCVVYL